MMKTTVAKFGLLAGGLVFAGGLMFAGGTHEEDPPSLAQVVALDECDPGTFNAALGPDFCRNVALGAATKLTDLFAKAHAGTPDRAGTSNLTQSTSSKEPLLTYSTRAANLTPSPRWRSSVAAFYLC
jgi:hypothetical protein